MLLRRIFANILLMLSGAVLLGCGGGSSGGSAEPVTVSAPPVQVTTFEVQVTNLTNAQPMSPMAYVLHDGSFSVFQIGSPASAGLEVLAEGGDTSDFVAEAAAQGAFDTRSGPGIVEPGATERQTFNVNEQTRTELALSLATMLVNTNDGFTAVNQTDLSGLEPGQSARFRTVAYDAGTEADSEGPGTIPGPADGGEGFNAQRDDNADRVSMHPGPVTMSDGLPMSVLHDQHRFDNPVLDVEITRVN